ncbi:MAG: hypothetical protein PHS02_03355, partial [Candidatus ainarchaeum sp.]|nr:hypothetical protein [Candidatus ainarchaeum sp.]
MTELLAGWQGIAGTAIIISIILSGIALGLGRGFSIKRLERFGADELIQSILNAAILGFAVVLSTMALQVGTELAPQANITCFANSTPTDYVLCDINSTQQSSFGLGQQLVRIGNVLAYYQTLSLDFGNFSIQPLANLNSVSTQISNSLYSLQFSSFASSINAQFLSFISSSWFGVIFASGLVLRSFFLSRKFGAFLIAAAFSLIIFYPLMIMAFQPPTVQLQQANSTVSAFLSNPAYAAVPIIDLNDNYAIGGKLYNMSFAGGQDFTGDLTVLSQQATDASAAVFFYSIIVPVLAFLATLVLIRELSSSFGG